MLSALGCFAMEDPHVVHDDVESGDSVRGHEQQLVAILFIGESVDISDFALGKEFKFRKVGLQDLGRQLGT